MLRRRFADHTLAVTVQERAPIARLMVQVGRQSAAACGSWRATAWSYEGVGYEPAALERLPWLDGVQLRRSAQQRI